MRILYLLFVLYLIQCRPASIESDGMVLIKGNDEVHDFWIDISPVTVADFEKFVSATGYITQAEKFGDGGVFDFKTGQWGLVKGADWRYPFGPDSSKSIPNHPVTQVSWNDATEYCKWAAKRLPTEREFVFAEKNGNKNHRPIYSWGDEFIDNKKYKTNFWQGSFPYINTGEDGFLKTSPVGYFGKSKLGLQDIEGNVWQWCSDESTDKPGEMNQRGGSFLCDPDICHGFKIGGQASSSAETSLCHVGFRCVRNK